MSSLSERFSQLANTAPTIHDPEDEINTETAAQVVDNFIENDGQESNTSQLRKNNSLLLSDIDPRYTGKKVSRKALKETSESEEDEEYDELDIDSFRAKLKDAKRNGDDLRQDEDEDEDSIELEEADNSDVASSDQVSEDESLEMDDKKMDSEEDGEDDEDEVEDDEEDEVEDNDEEDEEDGDEDEVDDDDDLLLVGEKDVIQPFSKIDINEEIEKGKAVQSQLALWDRLLEVRIKLQKMLAIANRLPQFDTYQIFQDIGGEEYVQQLNNGKKNVKMLLDSLLNLQEDILNQNPDTKSILEGGTMSKNVPSTVSNSDEEIPSDTEDEGVNMMQEEMEDKAPKPTERKKRKLKLQDGEYPAVLEKRFKSFIPYRNATIQKWNEKTRIASGKLNQKSFAAFEQSALKQIDQILADKERLRKRTQLKRSLYHILGKNELIQNENNNNESGKEVQNKAIDNFKDYDSEIFDDSDFYHQLLRELIERKTADINDPIALSRQWLEIQKLRGKMKKRVDTKASKGRKIRYDVHSKLINFMAPNDNSRMSDEAKNDLFASLFGKRNFSTGPPTSSENISLFSGK